jgi:protein-disulfide isomerase
MWPLIFWISLGFSIYSLILAGISSFIIHSYCLMCILGYLVNFALLYYAWFINRRFGDKNLIYGVGDDIRLIWEKRKSSIPVIAVLGTFFLTGPFWFPQYWHINPPKPAHALPSGITEKGHPWIGAENPALVIEEFTDYMCFQCRKMHYHLRRMLEAHPDKIRLVHRHFPMDHQYNPLVKEPYHIGAGKLALVAIQAKKNGIFWKASDYCYTAGAKREKIELADITSALNLERETIVRAFSDQDCLNALFHDIKAGLELGISATPSYLIDGKVYEGQIPPDLIKNVIK